MYASLWTIATSLHKMSFRISNRFRRRHHLFLKFPMAPTSHQILRLYRQLLARANKFDNYNFREHAKRRIHDAFKQQKNLTDKEEITQFYNDGINDLAMLKRQTTISQMFTFEKLVVEPLKKHARY